MAYIEQRKSQGLDSKATISNVDPPRGRSPIPVPGPGSMARDSQSSAPVAGPIPDEFRSLAEVLGLIHAWSRHHRNSGVLALVHVVRVFGVKIGKYHLRLVRPRIRQRVSSEFTVASSLSNPLPI